MAMKVSNAFPAGGIFAYSTENRQKFGDRIQECIGYRPAEIFADKLERFSTNGKPHDKAGWYIWRGIYGIFGNWRTVHKYPTWKADRYKRLSPSERRAIDRKIRQDEQMRSQAIEAEYKRVAVIAREYVSKLKPADKNHPYLVKKMILPETALQDGQALIIPVYRHDGITSYQRIYPDGKKQFLTGGRIRGCFHLIGNKRQGKLLICEGFATGATLHAETGLDVAVVFHAGNLLPAGKTLRAMFRERPFCFCADDDHLRKDKDGNPENIGCIKAEEAAKYCGGVWTKPQFGKDRPEWATDFNDLMQLNKKGVCK